MGDPDAPASERLKAMEALENRGLGRPKETVEHQVSKTAELRELSHDEREALYADLLRREAIEAGDPADGFA